MFIARGARFLFIAVVLLASSACTEQQQGTPGGDSTGSNTSSGATTSTSGVAGEGGSAGQGGAAQGGAGQAGSYQPEPIPEISDEPAPGCPEQTPAGYFQFLDNTCGEKVLPSDQDRDRACPINDTSAQIPLTGGGMVTYQPSSEAPAVDTAALSGVVPAQLQATVILVRRIGGVPHYRYLSTGDHNSAYQPWSTTKFLAAANAAATLRMSSAYKVGLTASVGSVSLGDLVTSVHNYDYNPYSSNGLGRYFHNIGGRDRANGLIHELWLGRPQSETFGGNYGAAAPSLGYTFKEQGGASVNINPDLSAGPANHLSSFTMAEAVKRLVLHREEADQRLPGIQWADLRVLFFGADSSAKYGQWGGMTADTAIYLQTGHDIDYIEKRSKGQWLILSKLGLGSSGQFLNVGYGCLPVLDDALQPVDGWGRELIISSHMTSGGASWAERDRLLAKAYRAIIKRVVDGRL